MPSTAQLKFFNGLLKSQMLEFQQEVSGVHRAVRYGLNEADKIALGPRLTAEWNELMESLSELHQI